MLKWVPELDVVQENEKVKKIVSNATYNKGRNGEVLGQHLKNNVISEKRKLSKIENPPKIKRRTIVINYFIDK